MGQLEEGGPELGSKDVGIESRGVFGIPALAKERDSGLREPKFVDTGRPSPRPKVPPERTPETTYRGGGGGGSGEEEASVPKRGSPAAGESLKSSSGLHKERSGGKSGGKFAKSGGSGPREGTRVGGKGGDGGRSGKSGATNSSPGSKDGAVRNGHGGASEGRSTAPEVSSSGQDGASNAKEGVQESKSSSSSGGVDGIDFDFGRWFSQSMQWPDQGRKLAAARTVLLQTKEKAQAFVEFSWPIVKKWSLLASRAMLVLSLLSLECGIRGVTSLFRLGSAALFLLVWCTAFNLGIHAGFFNFSVAFGVSLASGFLLGYTASFALIGLFGAVVLWMFGSFWVTGAIVVLGGVLFIFDHARKAILVTMLYSIYSVKGHGGWLGLIICTVLAFISSDIVIYFLSINNSEGNEGSGQKEKSSGQAHEQGNSKFGGSNNSSSKSKRTSGSSGHTAASGQGQSSANTSTPFAEAFPNNEDIRSSGAASTSATAEGGDPTSAEEEVARVLSSSDHYSVLGFARYDNFDVAVLKREYRKLAMLVHPDKNRGNGKAEEAFKRLQNAYEVLLDTIKRKVYDDELRREEVLANFRQHRQGSHQAARCHSPNCGCHHSEDEAEDDVPADSRRIACKKCNESHVWIATDRSKLRARWCLECQDYHQAKDGDGWVEQSGQSFFFGMFQKVDVPRAFACAEGKVYDVTEWVICQGMKCPPNTHKPTFHVSTAGAGKSVPRGPNRASRGGGRGNPAEGFPFPDFDENMTESEFFDWLQTAMASGMFSDLNGVPSYPGGRGGAPTKGAKPSRKKRKGKKQW